MSKKGFWTNKEVYDFVSVALNIYIAVSVIMFVLYLVVPLLDGKLFPHAIVTYGSWIGMGVYLKVLLKQGQKGLRIRPHEYVLLCLYSIICMFLWFPYPINILFSILTIIGIAFAYKAQQRRASSGHS